MNSGKVFLGLLAGIAAGATLGILFAPDKGSTTRRKISKKKDVYVDELGAKFNDFLDGITDKFEEVRKEVIRLAENEKANKAEIVDAMNGKGEISKSK